VFGKKLAVVEQQLSLRIEAQVGGRMAELEQQLRGEFEQVHARTVDAFVQTIENRVIGRIGTLESSLVNQAQEITVLREKTTKTDESLKKLLAAVERLCERAEERAQVPLVTPPAAEEAAPAQAQESFAAHYQRAIAQTETALPDPEPRPEPQLQYAASAGVRQDSFRREMQSFGLSLIGLAILGLRLIR